MSNNPVSKNDPLGDTTYRFNSRGVYLGMSDLDIKGIQGSVGEYKKMKDTKGKEFSSWMGSDYFSFNDPQIDKNQLDNMKVGDKKLQLVSDKEINDIMKQSGIKDKSLVSRWYFAGTQSGSARDGGTGNKMDFAMKYLNGTPGGGNGDIKGGFFIFGSQQTAFNAMDAGNWLWGQGMMRLGFGVGQATQAAQANEKWNDPTGDQRAIKAGYFHNITTNTTIPFVPNNKED